MRGLTLGDPALLGAAAGFSPLSLSPALWLDASDAATITSSAGFVSSWADKSGNGRNVTQGTSTAQPFTGSVTQNGRNVLTFDGGDFMTGVTGITGNANLTMFAVANVYVTGSTRVIAFLGAQVANNGLGVGFNAGNFYNAFIWAGAESQTAVNPGVNVHKTFAVTRAAGGNIQLYVNNVAQTANATAAMNLTTTFSVGRSAAAVPLYHLGTIGEIIVYPSVLSAANISAVQAYLNAKWAIY